MFEITNTLSFNADKLNFGTEYDYVTRTSFNQGILQTTGFVNAENLNESGVWSLGLLQMDFFYRKKKWYAGQFVRKIIPKFDLTESSILFFSTILNQQKKVLLSVLVRNVDETFNNLQIQLPLKEKSLDFSNPCDNVKNIDFDFMESFIRELEEERIRELNAYLLATGLKDYALSAEEEKALEAFKTVQWGEFEFKQIFNNIKQGRRLKKEDQKEGTIPFVMSGTTNTGVVGYISNPVASFPSNSITVDIFGNTFYRKFDFGAGDDTGVYWNDKENYSKDEMLFFTAAMGKSLFGKFDYGNKLRSSQSFDIKMQLPTKNNKPDYATMETFIKAVEKLVIKDVVLYADSKIKATENAVKKDLEYKINEDAGLLNVAD
ncbi:MAG: restriction endonuclease subunit S [Treponema sp.]|nr:restriction endonuclease subunit S [Treponema sp.]